MCTALSDAEAPPMSFYSWMLVLNLSALQTKNLLFHQNVFKSNFTVNKGTQTIHNLLQNCVM